MTKERKIAIEMWEYIRDNYDKYSDYINMYSEDNPYDVGEDAISNLKETFLQGKGVEWAMNCWFCEYIGHRGRSYNTSRCRLCPLQGCTTGPYYALTHDPTLGQYIDACNQIIEALGGNI